MKYTATDVEIIYRSAISNILWATERFERVIDSPEPSNNQMAAIGHLVEAADHIAAARDEWRRQFNTGDTHGDYSPQR